MLKKLKFFLLVFLLLGLTITQVNAFTNGGYVDGQTPGDCYLTFGISSFVSSNTVNVNTIRIDSVISDRVYVSTNMSNIPVSVSVTNTGEITATFNLNLSIFNSTLGTAAGGFNVAGSGTFTLAPGTTSIYLFTVNPVGPLTPTFPVIVDAVAAAPGPWGPLGDDNWWIAIDGSSVTGAVSPWLWDTRNLPAPISILVTPNISQGYNPTELQVTFSRAMDDTKVANFDAVSSDGTVMASFAGNWISAATTLSWVGTVDTTTWPDGLYHVSGDSAVDSMGITMNQDPFILAYTFEIDRLTPTVNLYHNPTANPGFIFPVTLVAVDFDVIPLAPDLWAEFLLDTGLTTSVQVTGWASAGGQGITWSGTVAVPINATQNSIATFNNLSVTDNAGLFSNVINSGATFNIGAGGPYITNLTFDGLVVINGDVIDPLPQIRFFIVDGGSSSGTPGIATASIRITMNGTLLVSGNALTQVGTTPFRTYECIYNIPNDLPEGTYTFEFGASDSDGIAAVPVVVVVRVVGGGVDLIRQPINWTNPFSPNGDGVEDITYIIYELTRSTPVRLYIFNMDGEIVWRKDIDEGQEGGHAGYNAVVWDGFTSFGDDLPNGVYIAHVIVNDRGTRKSLGRARIVILK
ncbi:gliding motility-associated C-terminal domain-containing protein [Candidatus Margulisiibacteriota bacterium]